MGFPDDGYDYTRHLRDLRGSGGGGGGGGGAFAPAEPLLQALRPDVKAYDASRARPAVAVAEEADVAVLEAAAGAARVDARCVVDPDIAAALERGDEDFERSDGGPEDELEDDFVLFANAGGRNDDVEDADSTDPLGDDKLSHSQMPASGHARHAFAGSGAGTLGGPGSNLDGKGQTEGAGNGDVASSGDVGTGMSLGGQAERPERTRRLLDERFEQLALREYDSDSGYSSDFTEFDNDSKEERSIRPTSAEARCAGPPAQLGAVLDKFLETQSGQYQTPADLARATGQGSSRPPTCHDRRGGGGDTAHEEEGGEEGGTEEEEEGEEEEEEVVWEEGGSKREQWDCETAPSTVNNLDNHPGRIPGPSAPPRPRRAAPTADGQPTVPCAIRLGGREQLPVDFLPGRGGGQRRPPAPQRPGGDCEPATTSEKRATVKAAGPRAGESPEDRRLRKTAVKEERRQARQAKKSMRMLYRGESVKAQLGAALVAPQGISLG
eukprot:SM000326S12430  [mRNA]  locus=s326:103491:105659:+ [translate_table: standard]